MKKSITIIIFVVCIILVVLFFILQAKKQEKEKEVNITDKNEKMKLTSHTFKNSEKIPLKYTCDSDDVNPELIVEEAPKDAESLVLIVDDPDAPGKIWSHWVLFNIPVETRKIEENSVPSGSVQGINDFGNNNYGGPCPPSGTHRYRFKLYALNKKLNLTARAIKQNVENAIKGSVIAEALLTGTYKRG